MNGLCNVSVSIDLRENRFFCIESTPSNFQKFGYNEHPLKTNNFLCIFVLAVSGSIATGKGLLSPNEREKQECISVRCVLPAHYRMGVSVSVRGFSLRETPPTDPPGKKPPWTETPSRDRDPPKTETETSPRGQTDACENITFAIFVCGR